MPSFRAMTVWCVRLVSGGEAVAVITGHTDDKGSRQGERTATDSSSTALFIVQREEENARRSYLDKRRSSRAGVTKTYAWGYRRPGRAIQRRRHHAPERPGIAA